MLPACHSRRPGISCRSIWRSATCSFLTSCGASAGHRFRGVGLDAQNPSDSLVLDDAHLRELSVPRKHPLPAGSRTFAGNVRYKSKTSVRRVQRLASWLRGLSSTDGIFSHHSPSFLMRSEKSRAIFAPSLSSATSCPGCHKTQTFVRWRKKVKGKLLQFHQFQLEWEVDSV